ncbi:MAG: ribonuclease Y [Deltaproteobacteria bacterium]|nr:ribonuclease Y [Deltaproteobacteria bacterium]
MNSAIVLGAVVLVSIIGTVLFLKSRRRSGVLDDGSQTGRIRNLIAEAEVKAKSIQKEAESSAKELILKGRLETEENYKLKMQELQIQERDLRGLEIRLERRHSDLDRTEQESRRLEQSLGERKKVLEQKEQEYGTLVDQTRKTLEKVSGISSEQAKKMLMDEFLSEVRHDAAKKAKQIEDEIKDSSEQKAKKIISLAVERLAGEWVQESTVSTVKLPSDDMKGRIIGREGRNIRTLEALTGVDLIIDETPGAVVLSSHNPVRREIARVALERLLQDGRIHPARIEETLTKVTQEVEKGIREAGQAALFELDIHGVHPEIVKLLGSLKFRYSYAQNVLRHSIEVGFLCGMMGAELGLNQKIARRAGLLHDIGKALTHEIEGSHAVIGGEVAKKYGEPAEVVHGIWAHHEDIPQESVLDHLVEAADALSGARPGARMEQAEAYVKRLEDLERIATSFDNIEKAYAIQAGRELRVMVQPGKVNDDMANLICRDIAKQIEKELTYPGQIKVTVIRETRAVTYAK